MTHPVAKVESTTITFFKPQTSDDIFIELFSIPIPIELRVPTGNHRGEMGVPTVIRFGMNSLSQKQYLRKFSESLHTLFLGRTLSLVAGGGEADKVHVNLADSFLSSSLNELNYYAMILARNKVVGDTLACQGGGLICINNHGDRIDTFSGDKLHSEEIHYASVEAIQEQINRVLRYVINRS